jgi:hypothetical protein
LALFPMSYLRRQIWGPAVWTVLHSAAATVSDHKDFIALLEAIRRTLPCEHCRSHLDEYLRAFPPEELIGDRAACSAYAYQLHSAVRARLGQRSISAREYAARYEAAIVGATVATVPTETPARPRIVAPTLRGRREERVLRPRTLSATRAYSDAVPPLAAPLAFRPRVAAPIHRSSAPIARALR